MNFPGISAQNAQQIAGPYALNKRGGFAADQMPTNKQITLTIKNTESYIAYFIMRDQLDYFLKIGELARVGQLYMPDIMISLLDDGGFETVSYVLRQMTMSSVSEIGLSYAAQLGQFNTFTAQFSYNWYDVYTVDEEGRKLISEPVIPQKDFPQDFIQTEKAVYNPQREKMVATKESLKKVQEPDDNPMFRRLRSVSRNPNPGDLTTDMSRR